MAAVEEERTILVPTNPDHVRDALRFFGEPWILFGEMVCINLSYILIIISNITTFSSLLTE